MEEEDDKGMDTTYVGIMLVVFLAIAALAINIGYLYVSEDDLQNRAETSALAGAQAMKQRMLGQLRTDSHGLSAVLNDAVQSVARTAAMEHATGKHSESALMHAVNNNTNRLTTTNDITVGFWNISSNTYAPGATPVNAIQVRTRRTAESEQTGLGQVGTILAKASGIQKFDYTPEAVAALPARANANFVLCNAACDVACSFPNVCTLPEQRMVREPWSPGSSAADKNRYAYTSLLYQQSETMKLSDMICMEMPAQEVCGKQVLTLMDTSDSLLRDMESMMYNPNIDISNKEIDEAGRVSGWWVIAPVTDCPSAVREDVFEHHTVTRYALVRISRICVGGATGCQQNNTSFDAPASRCGTDQGLYIDRISCVNCSSAALLKFPGLHPVLVK